MCKCFVNDGFYMVDNSYKVVQFFFILFVWGTKGVLRSSELCFKQLFQQQFYAKPHLVTHQATHIEEKVYKGSQCDKNFGTARYFITHMTIHSLGKPNKCSHCKNVSAKNVSSYNMMNTYLSKAISTSQLPKRFFKYKLFCKYLKKTHQGEIISM